ncbi:hypothetical protein WICPIJ_008734 [Wickerhamomyces pijperi]|uniref:Uncharacterized protein n=1 Tax=Wickerhamomyces pijperi TaxID=599730 RepID=A0A9P8THM1_WICPI|nr:hypothetical protein WICPIJ_008734 [Wickerhamomyces pijperi]
MDTESTFGGVDEDLGFLLSMDLDLLISFLSFLPKSSSFKLGKEVSPNSMIFSMYSKSSKSITVSSSLSSAAMVFDRVSDCSSGCSLISGTIGCCCCCCSTEPAICAMFNESNIELRMVSVLKSSISSSCRSKSDNLRTLISSVVSVNDRSSASISWSAFSSVMDC